MSERPNILCIVTDQHRGDCIGADPHAPTDADGRSLIHTPNIDSFVRKGAMFTRAYTPAPSCIPARRSLLTGQTPYTNGAPGWVTTPWEFEHTLPQDLRDAGYQTKLTGKIHSLPIRNHVGFESMDQHEALHAHPDDDYARWLEQETDGQCDELSHGLGRNSWDSRPWHLEEYHHPTNWTTRRAIEFLDQRDDTRPFFLNLSYVRPHTPFDPPQVYGDMYVDRDSPEPYMGDWIDDEHGEKIPDYPGISAWVADLPPTVVHRARAAYYGLITHIDHQIKRVFEKLRLIGERENTFVVFLSDHGEMLGDHHMWRKTYAYEGSARVPLLLRFPDSMGLPQEQLIDRPVGLEDVMPTLLSVAGVDVPDAVEGRNLLDLVRDPDRGDWREWYHGEHAAGSYDPENGTQYLIDGRFKYVWNPVTDSELLFDLAHDPGEERDLSNEAEHASDLERARIAMIDRLAGRPEGFVEDGELVPTDAGPDDLGDPDDCSSNG
ncbi:arylsulfatase [Natronosalvus rutilus]|uniref:Arylsulfatase n=1 Tax=Natronosalvus rutilus TaxID=2953753 RepID=A0A9E7N7R0_9EURY|nr:arylsulfatase [Natronosalvus rutilus]UTF52446.1 arylsulfatase [Natronosalvus rutilus]